MSYWAKPILALFYRGNKFTDPIDGKSYRKFLPYGYTKKRTNALAPGTLSLERHRLLWLYLQKNTDFFTKKNFKVLHFAPEQAFYKRFKKQANLDYTTTDLESPLADVKADICDLPFKTASFDIVFCNHVLEHIPDDTKAMQELFRILKPNGYAILQVPLDPNRKTTFEDDSITDKAERTLIFGQYDHLRIYGMDYFDKLAAVGFQVDAVSLKNQLSEAEIQRFAIDANEFIPVCHK